MAHVLCVAAFEVGHPVSLIVLVESGNSPQCHCLCSDIEPVEDHIVDSALVAPIAASNPKRLPGFPQVESDRKLIALFGYLFEMHGVTPLFQLVERSPDFR